MGTQAPFQRRGGVSYTEHKLFSLSFPRHDLLLLISYLHLHSAENWKPGAFWASECSARLLQWLHGDQMRAVRDVPRQGQGDCEQKGRSREEASSQIGPRLGLA